MGSISPASRGCRAGASWDRSQQRVDPPAGGRYPRAGIRNRPIPGGDAHVDSQESRLASSHDCRCGLCGSERERARHGNQAPRRDLRRPPSHRDPLRRLRPGDVSRVHPDVDSLPEGPGGDGPPRARKPEPEGRASFPAQPSSGGPEDRREARRRGLMPALYAFVLGGGVLALVGWAAWTLSGGFTVDRAGPDTPYRHAMDALLRGDRDEALLAFTETVRIDTDNADAYIHLGNLLRERGEAGRAFHIHRELTVRPGQTSAQQRAAREGLVLDLIALHRPEEAVEEAETLLELDPKDGRALRILLRAHEAARDWEGAFEVRSELARANGERANEALASYRSAIGESYLRAGKIREAEKHLRGALRLERNHPAALLP